jgi:amidophosphoribosyltransferase
VKGAYSLVMLTDDALVAARDPFGFRPLSLARLGGAWIVASETCAFDLIGAEFERDLEPGEVAVIRPRRLRHAAPVRARAAPVVLHLRADLLRAARLERDRHSVYQFRKELGRILAREHPVAADMIVPVLDSGKRRCARLRRGVGIPYETALIRNQYVKRTFIEPSASIRDFRVRIKHNAPSNLVGGKRVVAGRGLDRARHHAA